MDLETRILNDMTCAQKTGDLLVRRLTKLILSEFDYARSADVNSEHLDEQTMLLLIQNYQKRLLKRLALTPNRDEKKNAELELKALEKYLDSNLAATGSF